MDPRQGRSRRRFLAASGAAGGAWLGRGLAGEGGAAPFGEASAPAASPIADPPAPTRSTSAAARAERAFRQRVLAAEREKRRPTPRLAANGDEERYPERLGSYTKGLPHDARGVVDPRAYEALLRALASGRAGDFEAIPMGGLRLVNPLAGQAFSLEGPDLQALDLPPPPSLASAELAAEAVELYWQALLRDVPFAGYDSHPLVERAAEELSRLAALPAPRSEGRVTPALVFRGTTAGERVGPHVSQFLWKEVPYGSIRLVPQVRTATPGLDYLTTFEDWLAVQNGGPATARHAGAYRYVRSGRDLAAYVGLDFSYQAFLTAALVLFGMQGTTDAQRPYKGAPFDPANPYRASRAQTGFVTLGVVEALDLVARVSRLALGAAWFQKWMVHRRLRPEELGGLVHRMRASSDVLPVHDSLLASAALDLVFERHRSHLLPQAYPEGCPLHASYPAGHAVVAGAGATVLKAFFDEAFPVDDPVEPTAEGLALRPWTGPPLTVGGELDKLAGNVAYGRGWAGIHFRSDSAAGLVLGEQVALAVLAERRGLLPESFPGFSLTRFDGTRVRA